MVQRRAYLSKKTAPEIIRFQGLWSEMGDSNSRPDGPKEVSGIFYRRLYCFIVISASNQLLSIALVSAVSVYSSSVCGLTCGQRKSFGQNP